MTSSSQTDEDRVFQRRAVQAAVRIGLVALLAIWCFKIVRPFLDPIVWGAIIAVATQPLYKLFLKWLGGRRKIAATLIVASALIVLIGPTIALTANLVDTAQNLSGELHDGRISIPPPPESVEKWPVIGERVYSFWEKASNNIESVLAPIAPHLKDVALWTVQTAGATGIGIGKFIISILIAGLFLARAHTAGRIVRTIAITLAGERGPELTEVAGITVQSVTRGVLGVAVIQSLLSGLAMLLMGVPAAGLWALFVLILAVVQLPAMIVLLPVIIYVFTQHAMTPSIFFAIGTSLIGMSDTLLRPLLMGSAANVPMLVIFMGAIGGFLFQGIIGLFVGAVVLGLGYSLAAAWFSENADDENEEGGTPATTDPHTDAS